MQINYHFFFSEFEQLELEHMKGFVSSVKQYRFIRKGRAVFKRKAA